MRLAYFSPLNPVRSGISDYSEELLPHLSTAADIDLFVDGYRPSNPGISQSFGIYNHKKFDRLMEERRYDAIVYHMGNSPAHAYIYQMLFKRSGIVVLHDVVLHHLITWMAVHQGKIRRYLQEMEALYGQEGLELGKRVFRGQRPNAIFDYPLCEKVIRQSQGVIVHSRYAEDKVRLIAPEKPVAKINMGMPLPQQRSRDQARKALGLGPNTFVVSSIGFMNPYKRIDSALRAFRGLLGYIPDAKFVLVGDPSSNYDPKQTIRMLGLEGDVWKRGFATEDDFWNYVFASDVCLSLRYPTAGETSAAALRLMAAGRTVMVSDIGAFDELPGHCCVKIDVDDSEEEQILENLLLLAQVPALRESIGWNARLYIATEHTLAASASGYIRFIAHLTGRSSPASRVSRPGSEQEVSQKENESAAGTEVRTTESLQAVLVPRVEPPPPDLRPTVTTDREPEDRPASPTSPYLSELAAEAATLGVTEEDDEELKAIARVVAELLG
ncbi:MAG: glycosyltransferase family 4 protein [Chloroflexi bacterium]|nr:glycosyltransferase family 4 protein [Chloroflexota bacterium]